MTDAEYILSKDISNKKNIARSYYSKKGGSSTKCRLSSDNLTNAQWKRRNGEITTLKLNEKISYAEFKRLSRNYQELYLKNLIEKYGARQKDMASMMDVDANTLSAYIRRYLPDIKFPKNPKQPTLEWEAFMGNKTMTIIEEEPIADTGNIAEETEVKKAPVIADNSNDNKNSEPITLDVNTLHGNVTFKGEPYAVFARAVKMFDEGKKYTITIGFREEEEDAEETA